MVHALKQNEPTAIVDDCDDATPPVALRLGFGRRHHLACRCQAQRLLVQELGGSALRKEKDRCERKAPGNSVPHGNPLFDLKTAIAPPLGRSPHRCRRTPAIRCISSGVSCIAIVRICSLMSFCRNPWAKAASWR